MLREPIEVSPVDQVGPVHFIAAGGAGMSGIARLYHDLGVKTSGSDQADSEALRALQDAGVTTYIGHARENLTDARTVVVSSAIKPDNVELLEAQRRGLRIWHRSAALAALMQGKCGISVAGTHGKTTTTAMTAVVLDEAGLTPSYVIGGALTTTGVSAALGAGEPFIVEADESDGSFLQYPTEIAVVTNVEADHLDNWRTAEAYYAGFQAFATGASVRWLIVNVDDPGSRELAYSIAREDLQVITYGEASDADVRLTDVVAEGTTITATVSYQGEKGKVKLRVPGQHNLANAAAAYTVGRVLGLTHEQAALGLERFEGTLRRFQLIADVAGTRIFDDYAHHPTEIQATLTAARKAAEEGHNRIIACFQPHMYSRTADFAEEFGQTLALADITVITDVYGAREEPIEGVSGALIAESARRHGAAQVIYVENKADLPQALSDLAAPGDLILTIGAGDITVVGPALAQLLAEKAS